MALLLSASLGAQAQTTRTVTALWDANTDAYTVGYRLYYGTTSGTYAQNIDVGNVTSYPLTLAEGATYYFVVRAYNAAAQLGPASNEASITLTTTSPPSATLTATLSGTNTANVSWTTANATSVTLNGTAVAASGSQQFTISTTTTYTLVATGPGGSVTRTATVTPGTPAPTATLTATLSGTNTASVSWTTTNATTVTLNGTAVAASGSQQFTISTTTTFTLVATGPGGSVTSTATVSPGPVDCVVSAWTFQSATEWSACSGGLQTRTETWVRTVITPPSNGGAACPSLTEQRIGTRTCTDTTPVPPGTPVNLGASVAGNRVTVSWSPGATGGTPTGYFISAGTSPGGSELVDSLPVGNTLSVTGYLAQGTYYARVRAGNAAGYSAYSTEISFRIGARSRPRNPGFLTGSWHNGIVTLSWSRPSGDIEDGPTGYIIEAGSGPGQSDLATVPVGEVTSFQAAGIPAGVYYVRVRAVNELGVGPPSNEIVIQPGLGAGQPLNLRESGVGSMVELTWQAPSTGDPPVGYLLEAGSAPGLADLVVLPLGNVTAFATTAPPGVYYVRVRAVNAWGVAGPASNEVVVRR